MTLSPASTSPLDEGLRRFLMLVRDLPSGFAPGRQSSDVAAGLDVPEAFVEALFTSARARGLLKPDPVNRSRLRWTVSANGDRFLERTGDHPAATDG